MDALLEWLTRHEPIPSYLAALATIASAIAVIVYAVLTNRLIGVTRDQAEASSEQLQELKRQADLEYRPKLLFKRLVGGGITITYPETMHLYNFNRYPILIDYVRFHFRGNENFRAEQRRSSGLGHLRGVVEPFTSVEVALPKSIDGEEPIMLVSLYYGATGSQRYEYEASINLMDGVVTAENMRDVDGDNRFGFVQGAFKR